MNTTDENSWVNVANHLKRMAELQPYKRAVVYPAGWDSTGRVAYTHLTFQQLDRESDMIAHGLEASGIMRGTRTILMVRPSLEFFALTYAMFKVGAVPVIVDPGMGIRRMVACLQESKAEAFIGIPPAHVVRKIFPKYFNTIKHHITVGTRWFWGGATIRQFLSVPWQPYQVAKTHSNEMAAILFTTGSTGPAKGVIYTHGMFDAQVRYIKSHFGIRTDDVDLPTFPLFALFDPALGMTAVIPDMDPTRPAQADPEKLIDAIFSQGITNMFASPALLKRLGFYGRDAGVRLPTLKRVISAGAPASIPTLEAFMALLEGNAEIHTPYGATEAMPVLSLTAKEIFKETRKFTEQGYGICVGRPVKGIEVQIIRITDETTEQWSEDMLLQNGETGEIIVKGDVVSKEYYERPTDTALSKIRDGNQFWHRMGDLGWRDTKGRVWFCGRKSHRVVTENGTLFTIPCEAIFNQYPGVARSALVGVGNRPNQKPVIWIELENPDADREQIRQEILNMAANHELTKDIRTVMFHKSFPVDIRHNSKIFREQLAELAADGKEG
jgi:acyl-CoA synthetase (AMP-forming)/AMP-acid ligase II